MSFQPKILLRFTITSIAMVAIQLIAIGSSFALDPIVPQGTPSDLSISVEQTANERAFATLICNNGTDDIIGMVLDISSTNYDIDFGVSLPPGFAGSNASDSGSYDSDSGVWSGTVEPTQCVAIGFGGNVTGNVGDVIEFTATIL